MNDISIKEYQLAAKETDMLGAKGTTGLSATILGLVGQVGDLADRLKKEIRDEGTYTAFSRDVEDDLGDILWYLASISNRMGLDLDQIASDNIEKNRQRWPVSSGSDSISMFPDSYDESYPPEERLPRQFTAKFVKVEDHNSELFLPISHVTIDGEDFGDPVDDNVPTDDGYRFHDAMHIGHAAILGWSPVVRTLLKRKRKSNPAVDKFEDGARARDTEEALVKMVYAFARDNNYYDGATTVDTSLLFMVQSLVSDLEVSSRTQAEWQRCILESYAVRNRLVENLGGYVKADLDAKTIEYAPPDW